MPTRLVHFRFSQRTQRLFTLPLRAFALVFGVLGMFAAPTYAGPGPCTVDPALGNPVYAQIQTTEGEITLELWPDIAPCTINNFLAYVDTGRYDNTFIHRTVDGFVIQGGGYTYESGTDDFSSIPRDPSVINEPGASNLRGTIAMARIGGQVNSATSEFFINLSDNTSLDVVDEGFTVFGRVANTDMPVVDTIADLPRVVGRWTLNSALREVFGELPVRVPPSAPPAGYGCFDPDAAPETGLSGWTRGLVNTAQTAFDFDPLTGAIYFLSATCTGAGASGPPAVSCTTDRTVAYFNVIQWTIDPTPMTCSQIAESEESLAARRDDQQPQIASELVEVSTVLVPEPTSRLMLTVGLTGIFSASILRRRRGTVARR